jgi:hypothetical protein
MLRITTPHIDMWNTWYTWFDNVPEGIPPLVGELEEAATEVGRDPAAIERSAAVLVQMEGGKGRIAGSSERPTITPIAGSREHVAETLSRFGDVGVDRLQIVLDPIDAASIEELGEVARLIPRSNASG